MRRFAKPVIALVAVSGVLLGLAGPSSAATQVKLLAPVVTLPGPNTSGPTASLPLHPFGDPDAFSSTTFPARVMAKWVAAGLRTNPILLGLPPTAKFSGIPGEACQAHHIVPQGSPKAAVAVYYMALGDWSLQDTANGVLLNTKYHLTLTTTNAYYAYQTAMMYQMANLPYGRTPTGAHYYLGLYLNDSTISLNAGGGCKGIWYDYE